MRRSWYVVSRPIICKYRHSFDISLNLLFICVMHSLRAGIPGDIDVYCFYFIDFTKSFFHLYKGVAISLIACGQRKSTLIMSCSHNGNTRYTAEFGLLQRMPAMFVVSINFSSARILTENQALCPVRRSINTHWKFFYRIFGLAYFIQTHE